MHLRRTREEWRRGVRIVRSRVARTGQVRTEQMHQKEIMNDCASIRQVCCARLKGWNRGVAVKVQYPDAGRHFQDDVKAIWRFCEVLAPDNVCSLSALEDQNSKELDYHIEAGNLEGMTKNTTMGGFLPKELAPPPLASSPLNKFWSWNWFRFQNWTIGVRSYFSHWVQEKSIWKLSRSNPRGR